MDDVEQALLFWEASSHAAPPERAVWSHKRNALGHLKKGKPIVHNLRAPQPSETALSRVLGSRRSERDLRKGMFTAGTLSWLFTSLHAALRDDGLEHMSYPTAGGMANVRASLIVFPGNKLAPGAYDYDPGEHSLRSRVRGDMRGVIEMITGESWLASGSGVLVLWTPLDEIMDRYHSRAMRYLLLEAGHAAQNVLLVATEQGLRCCPVGAFVDRLAAESLLLSANERIVYLIGIG